MRVVIDSDKFIQEIAEFIKAGVEPRMAVIFAILQFPDLAGAVMTGLEEGDRDETGTSGKERE